MTTTCPSCGSRDYISNETCVCGYHPDESYSEKASSTSEVMSTKKIKEKVLKTLARSDTSKYEDEIPVKEIDSWTFTYSVKERCICIGTPALQSFRLKLAVDDLEDILERTYQFSGGEKTIRKSQLNASHLPELIGHVVRMIDEKRAKAAVNFSDEEIGEITELINVKLKA